MATKTFPVSWVGVYKASSNSYSGGSTIRVGGSSDYNTYIGVPSAVKDAIRSSSTNAKLTFRMNVTDGAEFDFGVHKESYNKASGTMPWYKYIGLHPVYATGWRTQDLTNDFMDDYVKGTYQGIVLYGTTSNEGEAYGKTGNSNEAEFIVEGTWNTAPTMPSAFTSPKSSTVVDQSMLISWTAGSDDQSPASQLSYELQYNNGTKWTEMWRVGAGVRNYTYSMRLKGETSRARLRVRAIDPEGLKSLWRYSPLFTVNHNKAPEKPTNLTPRGGKLIDRANLLRVTWKHNDDGAQAGYRLAWRTVASNGTKGAWTHIPSSTGFVNSTSQYRDFASNTFPLGEIEWTVLTKDQQGLASYYSTYERFYAGESSDAPIWIYPESGTVLNSSDLVASWSSLDQTRYEIKLLSSTGVTLWSENEIASNKATSVGYALQNEQTYTLQMRIILKASGLWSAWSETTFTTQFIPPVKPVLTIQTTDEEGTSLDVIQLSWTNDDTSQVTLTEYVEVYRREYNDMVTQEWILIADNQEPNSSITDYTPSSDKTYEYMVRSWGINQTYTDSDTIEGTITLANSFLHRALSPSDLLVLEIEEREQEFTMSGAKMLFANRKRPVFEYGIHEEMSLPISFYVDTTIEMHSITSFLQLRETFLYRDNVGRGIYCVLSGFNIKDLPVSGYEISLTLEQVDFRNFSQQGGI